MIGSIFKGLAKGMVSKGIVSGAITGGALYGAGTFVQDYSKGNYTSEGARAGASLLGGAMKLYGGARMATGAFNTTRRIGGSFMKSGIRELQGYGPGKMPVKLSGESTSLLRALNRGASSNRSSLLSSFRKGAGSTGAPVRQVASDAATRFAAARAKSGASSTASGAGGSSMWGKMWGAAHYPVSAPVKSALGWGGVMWNMGKGGPEGYYNMARGLSDMSNPFIGPALLGAGYGAYRADKDSEGTREVAPHYSSRGSTAGVNQNMFPRGISHHGNGVSSPVVFASQQVLTKRMMGNR